MLLCVCADWRVGARVRSSNKRWSNKRACVHARALCARARVRVGARMREPACALCVRERECAYAVLQIILCDEFYKENTVFTPSKQSRPTTASASARSPPYSYLRQERGGGG